MSSLLVPPPNPPKGGPKIFDLQLFKVLYEIVYILIEKYTTFSLKSIPLLVFNELLIKITSNAKTYDKNGYEARNLEKVLSRM